MAAHELTCAECDEHFHGRAGATFCSAKCKQRAYRKRHKADDPFAQLEEIDALQAMAFKILLLTKDIEIERDRSNLWQKLAGRYDDIRYALRNCDDNSEGHAEFYKQCCILIFGFYRDEDEDSDPDLL